MEISRAEIYTKKLCKKCWLTATLFMYVKNWKKNPKLTIIEWCSEKQFINRRQFLAYIIKHIFEDSLLMYNVEWKGQDILRYFSIWSEFCLPQISVCIFIDKIHPHFNMGYHWVVSPVISIFFLFLFLHFLHFMQWAHVTL